MTPAIAVIVPGMAFGIRFIWTGPFSPAAPSCRRIEDGGVMLCQLISYRIRFLVIRRTTTA